MSGYVIECALKACIARQTQRYDFPDRKRVIESYTHDLDKLVTVAGLRAELNLAISGNAALRQNWSLVADWSEEARYERRSEQEARDLYRAIADSVDGVFPWLQRYW